MATSARCLFLCGILSCSVRGDDGAFRVGRRVPEVWLCPPPGRVFDLASHPSEWSFSRQQLAGVKLYIGDLRRAEVPDLAGLAALLRVSGLQVAVECGGTLNADWEDLAGEKSAEIEMQAFARWRDAGGEIHFLDMDGPVRRLLGHGGWGKDVGKRFVSYDRCAAELMDYMAVVRREHPGVRFLLLTNFPNWGYRGDVSYHGRGHRRQDWGDYHDVVTAVLAAARASGIALAGATVDNPYSYLVGANRSVTLADPSVIDWIGRVRAYEDFCRANGLEFNLIINSDTGGRTSDRLFFEETLDMLRRYEQAGGRPDRYIVQSWYDHPKSIVPETDEHSMTALTKAVLTHLGLGGAGDGRKGGGATQ